MIVVRGRTVPSVWSILGRGTTCAAQESFTRRGGARVRTTDSVHDAETLGIEACRVGIVVVARNRAIARRLVERDRLAETIVRVEPDLVVPGASRRGFQCVEQSRTQTESARVGMEPHPLDLADAFLERAQGTAADRSPAVDDDEGHGGSDRTLVPAIELVSETAGDLAEIRRLRGMHGGVPLRAALDARGGAGEQ